MSGCSESDLQAQYAERFSLAQTTSARQQRHHISVGNWRLVLFIAAALIAYFIFIRHTMPLWPLIVLAAAFLALAFVDDAILRKARYADRCVRYYERGLSRLANTWQGTGSTGEQFASRSHAYSADLDLFTTAGLFQLLSAARTGPGEALLARWLAEPAEVNEIHLRHAAITELRTLLDFREALATAGDRVITDREVRPLSSWGEAKVWSISRMLRFSAAALSVAMASAIAWFAFADFLWLAGAAPRPAPAGVITLFAIAAIVGAFGLFWRRRVAESIDAFEKIRPGIALLSDLLLVLERAHFVSSELNEIQRELLGVVKPSRQIARLNRFGDLLDSRENLLLRIFGPPLLWTTQTAFALEQWRQRYGRVAPRWVEAVSKMEALSSLATYSFEHPGDPFPEITESAPEFAAVDLGHPLIRSCVPNSVSLTSDQALLIVSGSNMSGKSTLLRSVGVNAVLALAGAPVRARSLRLSLLSVMSSLHVADSLQTGASHFSAEISRIRQIIETAGNRPPVLFLIDEILQGTNSNDRRVGAEAVLIRLLNLGAIGVITTHDLALTRIAGGNAGRVVNAHFRDHIQNGRMEFDYKLKPGVVQGSNALELMRLYGLI